MALQMVRSFFGQGTPSRSRVHEPVIGIESLGNQGGNSSYDRGDVGKSAASNWFELARHPTSELGRKPHIDSTTVGHVPPGHLPPPLICHTQIGLIRTRTLAHNFRHLFVLIGRTRTYVTDSILCCTSDGQVGLVVGYNGLHGP